MAAKKGFLVRIIMFVLKKSLTKKQDVLFQAIEEFTYQLT